MITSATPLIGTDRPGRRVSPTLWPAANAIRAEQERKLRRARALEFASGLVFGMAAMFALSTILLCAVAPEALATLIGLPPQMELQQPQQEQP